MQKPIRTCSVRQGGAIVLIKIGTHYNKHPPDQIIKGKPKWTEVGVTSVTQGEKETPLNIDRLNPSRHLVEDIETSWRDNAEDAQRVMVNMMSDLNCELLVTLSIPQP